MGTTVLVPIDDSDPAWNALDYAIDHHGRDSIVVVHVLDPTGLTTYTGMEGNMVTDFEDIHEHRRDAGKALLERAYERANATGVTVETEILTGRPAGAIVECASDEAVDHIVIGSHGRTGVGRVLLGSVAETVIRRSPVPVTVVH